MSRYFGFALALLSLAVLAGCSNSTSSIAGRKKVAVDSFILEDFINDLAGSDVELVLPVPVGVNPEDWKPTADDLAKFQSADLILLNGAGASTWAEKASLPSNKVVDTSAAYKDKLISIEKGVAHSHGDGKEHTHTGLVSTTWFDRDLAAAQLEATKDALVKLVPGSKETIEQNYAELENRMDIMYNGIDANCSNFKNHRFVGSHPVYQYLARRQELNFQYVHWEPQNVPTAEQLEELKKMDPHVLVWEDTPNPEADKAVRALDIETFVLRPLTGRVENSYWSKEMKRNGEELKKLYFLYRNNKAKKAVVAPQKPEGDEKGEEAKSDEKADEKAAEAPAEGKAEEKSEEKKDDKKEGGL